MKRFTQISDMLFMLLLLLKNNPAQKSNSISHIL